jgi:hypothetical protein
MVASCFHQFHTQECAAGSSSKRTRCTGVCAQSCLIHCCTCLRGGLSAWCLVTILLVSAGCAAVFVRRVLLCCIRDRRTAQEDCRRLPSAILSSACDLLCDNTVAQVVSQVLVWLPTRVVGLGCRKCLCAAVVWVGLTSWAGASFSCATLVPCLADSTLLCVGVVAC